MLNEWNEYACYLSSDLQKFPMQKEALTDKDGFRRPLKILTRGFLEKWEELEQQGQGQWSREQKVTGCKWFLLTWLNGLTAANIPVFQDLPAELQQEMEKAGRYGLMYYAEKKLDAGKLENYKNMLKSMENAPYYKGQSFKRNDYGTIYLDQVISDALNRLPLRKQCLVLKGDTVLEGICCKESMRQVALAAVAFYLQTQEEYCESKMQTFLDLNYAELGNWLDVYFTNKGADRQSVPVAINTAKDPEGQLLFEKLELPNGNKLRLSAQWIHKYQPRLVDEEEKGNVGAGYWVVSDGERKDKSKLLTITAGK